MTNKRIIQVFNAGCPLCSDAVDMINRIECASCELEELDMKKTDVSEQARNLGIRTVPAVVIDGKLAGCCGNSGPDEKILKSLGVGIPL